LLLFIAGIYLVTYSVAATIAESLPWPLDEIAWKWIEGEDQQVGHPEMGYSPVDAGKVMGSGTYYWAPEFYTGPTSFICRLPVEYGYLVPETGPYGSTVERSKPHTGIDYGTYGRDEDVIAVMGGLVTYADWNYYLGWMVVVENNGFQTIYGHMCCGEKGVSMSSRGYPSLQVNAGEEISAGTVLGRAGTTGNSTGVHLHFEVRVCDTDGKCQIVDPGSVYLAGQDTYCDWVGFESHKR
jgi:murein DD-endopeptidase MepM/ murein hydrolase activator NlpD